jgi:hypothetical protein
MATRIPSRPVIAVVPFVESLSDYATLMVEILKDNARTEAGKLYAAMDMGWAELFGLIAQSYGK